MAKAIVTAATLDVICPACKEPLPAPGGSLFFECIEYIPGTKQRCACGVLVTFPNVKRVAF